MSKQRLSKLQKVILVTLIEKDKIDEQGWYKNRKAEPPYWHSTRDWYGTLADGDVFHTLREKGVSNTVKDAGKFNNNSFLPSFSRSIRSLEAKSLIEKPERLRGERFDFLKLTEKALKLISSTRNLTIRA